jgi:prephenate dehydrogenase
VLDEHLHQLQHLRELLAREDYTGLTEQIQQANHIRKIIP